MLANSADAIFNRTKHLNNTNHFSILLGYFGKFNCGLCEKKFKTKSRLQIHLNSKLHKDAQVISQAMSGPYSPVSDCGDDQPEDVTPNATVEPQPEAPGTSPGEEDLPPVPVSSASAAMDMGPTSSPLELKVEEMERKLEHLTNLVKVGQNTITSLIQASALEGHLYNRDLTSSVLKEVRAVKRLTETRKPIVKKDAVKLLLKAVGELTECLDSE